MDSPFARGLLCNPLNVKAALFFTAVCTPFIGAEPTFQRALAIRPMIVGLGMGLCVPVGPAAAMVPRPPDVFLRCGWRSVVERTAAR